VADVSGYGRVTKTLHWLTFAALTAQFALGYLLEVDGGRGRGRGHGGGPGRGRGRGGEDLDVFDDTLLTVHVFLGVAILTLALIRIYWRLRTPLPPWAPTMSHAERRIAHWTERILYLLLLVIPATGLVLVFVTDDAVGLHIASHVAFYIAFAFHIGLVLKHQLIKRDRLLRRML
jgi:cytochrome b561